MGRTTTQVIALTLSGLLLTVGIFNSNLVANAVDQELSLDKPVLEEVNKTLQRIKDKDPNKLESAKLTKNNNNSFISNKRI